MRFHPALLFAILLSGCGDPPSPVVEHEADGPITAPPATSDRDAAIALAQRGARDAYGARVALTPVSAQRGALIAPGETQAHEGWTVVFPLAPTASPPAVVIEAEVTAAGGLPVHAHPPGSPSASARAAPAPRESQTMHSAQVLVRVRDDERVQVLPLAR